MNITEAVTIAAISQAGAELASSFEDIQKATGATPEVIMDAIGLAMKQVNLSELADSLARELERAAFQAIFSFVRDHIKGGCPAGRKIDRLVAHIEIS